jgi:hypothetical protein
VLALLLLAGGVTPVAVAQPAPPHQFYGNVYIGGSPASLGTKVEAYVNDVKAAETTVDSLGRYGYSPLFKVPGSAGTVTFYIGATKALEEVAWQSGGINRDDGQPLNLTITGTPPTVTTNAATNITCTTATLNGNLTSRGTASSVQVSFEWGLTEAYGNTTTPQTKNSTGTFSASISGLTPGETYHFRVKAVGVGTAYGDDSSFTTSEEPGGPLDIVTACPLTGGRVNQSYSVTLQASGGTPAYAWSKVSGTLPTGLNLSAGGVISGTPTATGTFSFTIKVTDSASPTPATKQKACSITISTGPPAPVRTAPSMTLKWNASTGATKYWLQVNTKSTFKGTDLVNADVGNVTVYELTGLSGEKGSYYWRVKAGDASSWGDWSTRGRIYWK